MSTPDKNELEQKSVAVSGAQAKTMGAVSTNVSSGSSLVTGDVRHDGADAIVELKVDPQQQRNASAQLDALKQDAISIPQQSPQSAFGFAPRRGVTLRGGALTSRKGASLKPSRSRAPRAFAGLTPAPAYKVKQAEENRLRETKKLEAIVGQKTASLKIQAAPKGPTGATSGQ